MTSLSEIYAGILSLVQAQSNQSQQITTARSAAAGNTTGIALSSAISGTLPSSQISGTIPSTQVTPLPGMYLLHTYTVTASSVASIDGPATFSSAYSMYELQIFDIFPATTTFLILKTYTGPGSSASQTFNYMYNVFGSTTSGVYASNGGTSAASVELTQNVAPSSVVGNGASGYIRFYNPFGAFTTVNAPLFSGSMTAYDTTNNIQSLSQFSGWPSGGGTTAGFNLSWNSGANVETGYVKLYGYV